jgi:hypothetical protein
MIIITIDTDHDAFQKGDCGGPAEAKRAELGRIMRYLANHVERNRGFNIPKILDYNGIECGDMKEE